MALQASSLLSAQCALLLLGRRMLEDNCERKDDDKSTFCAGYLYSWIVIQLCRSGTLLRRGMMRVSVHRKRTSGCALRHRVWIWLCYSMEHTRKADVGMHQISEWSRYTMMLSTIRRLLVETGVTIH